MVLSMVNAKPSAMFINTMKATVMLCAAGLGIEYGDE